VLQANFLGARLIYTFFIGALIQGIEGLRRLSCMYVYLGIPKSDVSKHIGVNWEMLYGNSVNLNNFIEYQQLPANAFPMIS